MNLPTIATQEGILDLGAATNTRLTREPAEYNNKETKSTSEDQARSKTSDKETNLSELLSQNGYGWIHNT